jgi:hypothetical protein
MKPHDFRVSARFWGEHAPVPEFAKGTGLKLAMQKKAAKRPGKTNREFYASTADFKANSEDEVLKILTRIYDAIAASKDLSKMVVDKLGRAEVWVVSFGLSCKLEEAIGDSLTQKIESSKVSLYTENYPTTEDENPTGHFIFQFR